MRALSVFVIVFLQQSPTIVSTSSTITKFQTYSFPPTNNNDSPGTGGQNSLYRTQISTSSGRIPSKDKANGNVIFNDSFAFGSSSEVKPDGIRNTRNLFQETGEQFYFPNWEGDEFLQNHRLEEPSPPSSEVVSSAAAAAVAASSSSHFIPPTDSKLQLFHDAHNTRGTENTSGGTNVVADASGGQGRTLVPGGQYGWASNPGSCLFSCGGFGATSPSCCQQNYIQCCPNPIHESVNFKNLHHGRGHIAGGGGGIGKIGYGWGSIPYNPPPIIRPKPCQGAYPHHPYPIPGPGLISQPFIGGGGGSIIHKGIETLKHGVHNIGQLFKDHVGGGWTSGGNAAAGYYFHRRSDKNNEDVILTDEISSRNAGSKKTRHARSIHKGFDHAAPCPVYSFPPSYTAPIAKPYTAGLGSLIGWSKPGNHASGYALGGGAYGYGGQYHHHHHHQGVIPTKGFGWRGDVKPEFGGSNHCKWDYDCPGVLKCCKGICQIPPQHIFK